MADGHGHENQIGKPVTPAAKADEQSAEAFLSQISPPVPTKGTENARVGDQTQATADATTQPLDFRKEGKEVIARLDVDPSAGLDASKEKFAAGKTSLQNGGPEANELYNNFVAQNTQHYGPELMKAMNA
jgi:hypothetical protein